MQGNIFKREPALWIAAISAILGVIVSFGWSGLDDADATNIMALINAGAYFITAIKTRPVALSAFTGLLTTGAILAAGYGFDVPQATLGALQLALVAVVTLVLRGQVTPAADPRPLYAGDRGVR